MFLTSKCFNDNPLNTSFDDNPLVKAKRQNFQEKHG